MEAPLQNPTPLTPSDEMRLKAAARWAGDPIELAETLNLPLSDLLDWLASPRITTLLNQYDQLQARCDLNRARQAQSEIATTLTTDFQDTDDPKERRRISTPLLRANTPLRQARTTTTRARAGSTPSSHTEPTARAAGQTADGASHRALPRDGSEHHTQSEGLLPALASAGARANAAVEAFTKNPPDISRAQFMGEIANFADATEASRAGIPAPDPGADPFTSTPASPPVEARTTTQAIPAPAAPVVTPSAPLIKPAIPAAATLRTLLAALHESYRYPEDANTALLQVITPDFTFDGRPLTPETRKKLLLSISIQFNQATYRPETLDLAEPSATEHQITLRIHRGHHVTPFIFSFTRAHTPDRWQLSRIDRKHPPGTKGPIARVPTARPP